LNQDVNNESNNRQTLTRIEEDSPVTEGLSDRFYSYIRCDLYHTVQSWPVL